MPYETKLFTWREFVANPEFKHYELVAGEPVPLARFVTPVAHGIPQLRLAAALVTHVDTNRLGLVTNDRLWTGHDPDTIRVPDAMYASTASLEGVDVWTNDPWPKADLAVEVRSESQTLKELQEKMAEYFQVGVREVWVIDWKRRTVITHRPNGESWTYIETDTLEGGDVVPGFRYPLAQLFKMPSIG
jgi:Uma2 family endonuclease